MLAPALKRLGEMAVLHNAMMSARPFNDMLYGADRNMRRGSEQQLGNLATATGSRARRDPRTSGDVMMPGRACLLC